MKSAQELRTSLHAIDRKSYPAYKGMAGSYSFGRFSLSIDHVQGDPFASPSSVHVEISHRDGGFPQAYLENPVMAIALQDWIIRQFAKQVETYSFKAKGSGKSGLISITRPGQEVLERSACEITQRGILVRFHVGFPAFGRTIDAGGLEKILFDFLPKCVEKSLVYANLDKKSIEQALYLAEDQEALREILKRENLVSFVANGSVLPRKSGVSDLPMKGSIPFQSPKSMEKTFILPHCGSISGMGIEKGITLIVGGGYHGKSTLLSALQMGVYNHIAGDGRELVLTDASAIKLRAEEGRFIRNTDISLFINDLPNGKDTKSFSTEDASGSTSQAAGVIEGLEAESKLFLIDEDTSATNFMVRDEFMQQVISREKEPITPFLERAKDLKEKAGVSTVLVAGSSGAFFYIADRIIQMDAYRPVDITDRVKKMCTEHTPPRTQAENFMVPQFTESLKIRGSKNDRRKTKSFGTDGFSIDRENVELRYVEQLADGEQTAALARMLVFCLEQVFDGKKTTRQLVETVWNQLEKKGWDGFCGGYVPCGLAKPRREELFACLNRYRG